MLQGFLNEGAELSTIHLSGGFVEGTYRLDPFSIILQTPLQCRNVIVGILFKGQADPFVFPILHSNSRKN